MSNVNDSPRHCFVDHLVGHSTVDRTASWHVINNATLKKWASIKNGKCSFLELKQGFAGVWSIVNGSKGWKGTVAWSGRSRERSRWKVNGLGPDWTVLWATVDGPARTIVNRSFWPSHPSRPPSFVPFVHSDFVFLTVHFNSCVHFLLRNHGNNFEVLWTIQINSHGPSTSDLTTLRN